MRDGMFWQLTDSGLAFLSRYENIIKKYTAFVDEFLAKKIDKKWIKNRQEMDKKLGASQELEPIVRYFSDSEDSRLMSIISNIEERLGRQLDEVEYSIVSFLVNKTGKLQRKYLWPPEQIPLDVWLSDETGYDTDSVRRALQELEALGVVYITRDTRRGLVKIRLDRSLSYNP